MAEALKVYLPGKGSVSLAARDHLATGGEGAVYVKNQLVYKVFLDPVKAQQRGMLDKIALLQAIKHPSIISPQDVLLDKAQNVIGYYMREAPGLPLMKSFTNSWRDPNGFTAQDSTKLVQSMREGLDAAHAAGALVVDGNETNYLFQGTDAYMIDVDSWQIGSYKATALMLSIKDYQAAGFSQESDWFAWAVVSFQVFTGIHPYKGTHPDFSKGDLDGRMRAKASVLNPRVKVSPAVRDFSVIPSNLRSWYEAVFNQGERCAPPRDFHHATVSAPLGIAKRRTVAASGAIQHLEYWQLPGNALKRLGEDFLLMSQQGTLLVADARNRKIIEGITPSEIAGLNAGTCCLVRKGAGNALVQVHSGQISARVLGQAHRIAKPLPLQAQKLVQLNNCVFASATDADNGLIELSLVEMGAGLLLSIKTAWPVAIRSTQFSQTAGVSDCLGMPFLVLPTADGFNFVRAKQLKGRKILDVFSAGGTRAWVLALDKKAGVNKLMEFRVDAGAVLTAVSDVEVEMSDLNMAVTSKGVTVAIVEDGFLELSSLQSSRTQQVADPSITQLMPIFSMPQGIFYFEGSRLMQLKLS